MSVKIETAAFKRFVDRYARTIPAATDAAVRKLAMAVLSRVIDKAPVDTGRHRAGWTVAAQGLGMPPPPQSEGMTTEERGDFRLRREGSGVAVELVNGVVYSMRLEEGWSAQAPFGMVRLSMREIEAELSGLGTDALLPEQIKGVYAWAWRTGRNPMRSGGLL